MQYMRARLIAHSKEIREDGSIIEIVIWELPKPLHPSSTSIDRLLDDFERDIAMWGAA